MRPARGARYDCPIDEATFWVIDLEMTGTDPTKDHVCEVGLVVVERGRVVDEATWLVRAPVPVGDSQAIHGIDDAMLATAPTLDEVGAALEARVERSDAFLVGHRVDFDLSFWRPPLPPLATWRDAPAELDGVAVLDTWRLAQRALDVGSVSLRSLAERLDLPRPNHRALPDARATEALFRHLVAELAPATVGDLAIAQRLGTKAHMRDDIARLLRHAHAQGEVVELVYRVPGRKARHGRAQVRSITPPHCEVVWLEVDGVPLARPEVKLLRGDRIVRAGQPAPG